MRISQNKIPLAEVEIEPVLAVGKRTCPECGVAVHKTLANCPVDGTVIEEPKAFRHSFAGKYQFVCEIGSGGMGVIYKAKQPLLDRYYAIKMLNLRTANQHALARFHQEAKAACTLNHPNVISVHDFGFTENQDPYMVMDFVDGMSLSNLIATIGSIPYREALRIFVQIADGMNHAHALGVLHRDLKPSNVMLSNPESSSAEVKIVDFGIAKINRAEDCSSLTQTGDVFGSPLYMSPEQASGKRVDARSDIYSLGCLMYEVLTGKPPLQADTMIQTMFMHLNTRPPALVQKAEGKVFPVGLEYVVQKCLEKEPSRRYQTMYELKLDLIKILAEQSIKEQKFLPPAKKKRSPNLSECLQIVFATFVFLAAGYSIVQQFAMHALVERREEEALTTEKKLTSALQELDSQPLEGITAEAFTLQEIAQRKDSIDFPGMVADDAALKLLEGNVRIRSLGLRSSNISPTGFKHLQFPNLQRLDLQDNEISVELLDAITHLPELNSLSLSTTTLTDLDLMQISKINKLTALNLTRTRITDKGCKILAGMTSLQELHISANLQISDTGVSELKNLKNLQLLDLNHTSVTDTGIASLKLLPNLTDLILDSTHVTDGVLKTLSKMHLKKLFLGDCDITNRAVQPLSKMKSLIFLDIRNNSQISPSMLEYLEETLGRNNTAVRIDKPIQR